MISRSHAEHGYERKELAVYFSRTETAEPMAEQGIVAGLTDKLSMAVQLSELPPSIIWGKIG